MIDGPNTRPGHCPECGLPANIWNDTKGVWECCFCNWFGVRPNRESHIKNERSNEKV